MNYFAIALLSLFIYVLVHGLVNRICECKEICEMYKHITPEQMEKILNGKIR